MKIKTKHKNLRDVTNRVLPEKFISLQAYGRKEERFQINDLKAGVGRFF